jgi:hypothetical protein
MVNKKNEESKIKYFCPICLKSFGNRKDNYQNHIKKISGCGAEIIKLEEIKMQKDILDSDKNKFLNVKNDNLALIELMKKIINQNEKMNNNILDLNNDILDLKNEISILKEDNENLKNKVIQYNTTNNNNNNCIVINNFNDTNYKGNFNNLLKEKGKSIYLQTLRNVFLNPQKPENHTFYIADKSRGLAKIYNNGLWETKNMNLIVDKIIDSVVEYFNLSIEKIKEDRERYEKLKKTIVSKVNYIQLCDLEYLDDLEDDTKENKERIQRCKDFRQLVYDEIIILFHDNKKTVLDTHKKQKINKSI